MVPASISRLRQTASEGDCELLTVFRPRQHSVQVNDRVVTRET
ncbi:hypothetical protein LINGRAHAP2_LOCUS14501 [Linum grandiflorum]